MSDTNNEMVTVSGISPANVGDSTEFGKWFLIDQSGDFSVDKTLNATIWLVGGGCDGGAAVWKGNRIDIKTTNTDHYTPIANTKTGDGISYSGAGGDGGYVYKVENVKIPKNKSLTAVIASANNKIGTSLVVDENSFSCSQSGASYARGGNGGSLPPPANGELWGDQSLVTLPTRGTDGVRTPYGYVGSSGGGGAACNGTSNADNGITGGQGAGSGTDHRSNGTPATTYGSGGGGGAFCGFIAVAPTEAMFNELATDTTIDRSVYTACPSEPDIGEYASYPLKGWFFGGMGKGGCIIVAYTIEEEPEKTLIVQKHYKRVCNTKKTCNTDYYSSSSRYSSCGNNGCGCGQSGQSVEDAGYTDTLHIGIVK